MELLGVDRVLDGGHLDAELPEPGMLLAQRGVIFHFKGEVMRQARAQATRLVSRQAEESQHRTWRKIFVAGVIEVRATLFIEIVSLLDQAKTHLLNEEILGSLGVAGDRRDVVEAAKREVRRNLWKRLWPSFGGDLKLVAPRR